MPKREVAGDANAIVDCKYPCVELTLLEVAEFAAVASGEQKTRAIFVEEIPSMA
jgi:hypothetical protein